MYGNRGQQLTANDVLAYLQEVKEIFQDRTDIYDGFLEVMKDLKARRINPPGVIARVKELFRGHSDLILGFNTFLPKGYEITLPPEDEPPITKKPVNLEEAISFVSKIKTRCQGDGHVYKSFLDILNMYKRKTKSIKEVYQEVAVILHGYPDLIEEFSQFLPVATAVRVPHDEKQGPITTARSTHVEKKAIFSNAERDISVERPDCEKSVLRSDKEQHRVVEREQEYNDHAPAVDCAADHFHQGCNGAVNNGSSWNDENMSQPAKENLDKSGDNDGVDRYKDQYKRERERPDRGTTVSCQEVMGQKVVSYSIKDKYMSKCIQELDLSNCERCTPSYRLLPKNYPIPLVSQRTKIGAEVLNDHWVSVTSGSEDYSFKHMRKNQYEESLFRCEDDRFELDMLLESVNVATKLVEELLDKINDNAVQSEPPICIEDHFTALNRRCIERLYGEHGVDVMDVLRKNAPLALPVILTRLKQKQEECARCRVDFNKVWAEIYAKNYHKSLDHRSFYFKQQDTKSLSTRALLGEIKEHCEKQKKGDDVLRVAAGSRQPIIPHMEFSYPDPEIHEDLYQLIKHSCQEVCSTEHLDKVMRIWSEFLEPMLGVPSRPQGAGDTEGVMKDKLANSYDSDVKDDSGSYAATAVTNQNQSIFSGNGDDSTPSEHSTPSRVWLVDNMVQDDGSHGADCNSDKNGTSHNIPHHGALQVKTNSVDDASGVASYEQPGSPSVVAVKETLETPWKDNAESLSGGCSSLTRPTDITAEGVLEKHLSVDSESRNCRRTMPSLRRIVSEGIRSQGCHEPSIQTKREEGVISPDVEVEDNFAGHGNSATQIAHSTRAAAGRQYERAFVVEKHGQAERQNVSVAGNCEESGRRYSKIRGSASQNVGFSETYAGDGEGCSPLKPGEDGKCDGNENKVKNEGNTEGDRALFPFSEEVLLTSRPITRIVPPTLQDKKKDSRVFYGNDSFYVLFRLHQTLYERIQKAKLYSSSSENRWRVLNDINPTDSYARFMTALYSLVDGSSDNAKFEDDCRSIVGTQCHVLFTLDKLIYKLVKQLQTIATDEVDNRLLQLYAYEESRDPAKFSDVVYHENARVILPDENVYRIECASATMRLSVQLMECAHDKPDVPAVSMEPHFAAYLHNDVLSVVLDGKEKPGVYLKRNKRKNAKGDEASAFCDVMEGVLIINRLECKINCSTSKAGYVMDTEDFFCRTKKRRRTLYSLVLNDHTSNGCSRRVRRICKLLSS